VQTLELTFDVSAACNIGIPLHVAASLHLPDAINSETAPPEMSLIFAIHGGGYTRQYWHPTFAEETYSFAEFFTKKGQVVLAIDMLGMGRSSKPEDEALLSRATIATAHDSALRQAIEGLSNGQWSKAQHVEVTGMGHSMGGMMIITQAAAFGGMNRLASLGWANAPMQLDDMDSEEMQPSALPTGYLPAPREAMRGFFYAGDVSLEIIEADEAHGSLTPSCMGRDALTPAIVKNAAAALKIPVLVVQSSIDTSSDPQSEAGYFTGSPDVQTQILEGAAHCQNFASNRAEHWAALHQWMENTSPARV